MTRPLYGSGATHPHEGGEEFHRVTAAIARRETPGPIPNPEAKPLSADGTAWETTWESRTPPNTHSRWAATTVAAHTCFWGNVAPAPRAPRPSPRAHRRGRPSRSPLAPHRGRTPIDRGELGGGRAPAVSAE